MDSLSVTFEPIFMGFSTVSANILPDWNNTIIFKESTSSCRYPSLSYLLFLLAFTTCAKLVIRLYECTYSDEAMEDEIDDESSKSESSEL
jgi:hypothetical protein